jgi:hypothetical protein
VHVTWGADDVGAEFKFTRAQWRRILAGEVIQSSTWSWDEGRRARVGARFNCPEKGDLHVGGDDCTDLFSGTLDDATITGAEYPTPPPGATIFEVLEAGTLLMEGVELPNTRAEAYDLDPKSLETAGDLIRAAEDCPPLDWHLDRERDEAGGSPDVAGWLESLPTRALRTIIRDVRQWLRDEPDWAQEDDYIPRTSGPQGAALEFFRDWDSDDLLALGVRIVEGEHPGSSYYAAELVRVPSAANATSVRRGFGVWFRRKQA